MAVLVGKEAIDFSAAAVVNGGQIVEDFKLSDYRGKDIVLFFYPLDFTFVCPTELHAFQEKLTDFESRGVQVIGVSIDSQFSHYAWLTTPRSHGGIEGVQYPLVADVTKTITKAYDVEVAEAGIAYRGLFLIDKNFVVRHQVINDLPLGRNVDEAIRMVDALHFFEENGEVCPANWSKGSKGMVPTQDGLETFFGE